MAALLVLSVLAAVTLVLWTVRCMAAWRMLAGIPGPPASHPVLGHASVLTSERGFEQITAWAQEYGSVFKLRVLLHQPVVVVSDPSEAKALLSRGPRCVLGAAARSATPLLTLTAQL